MVSRSALLLVICLLVASCATDESIGSYTSHDVEYKMAAIDNDGVSGLSEADLDEYGQLLDSISSRCGSSREHLGDIAANLTENDGTMLDLLQAMEPLAEGADGCEEPAAMAAVALGYY